MGGIAVLTPLSLLWILGVLGGLAVIMFGLMHYLDTHYQPAIENISDTADVNLGIKLSPLQFNLTLPDAATSTMPPMPASLPIASADDKATDLDGPLPDKGAKTSTAAETVPLPQEVPAMSAVSDSDMDALPAAVPDTDDALKKSDTTDTGDTKPASEAAESSSEPADDASPKEEKKLSAVELAKARALARMKATGGARKKKTESKEKDQSILIVDDEKMPIDVVIKLFENEYNILSHEDSDEGLKLFKENQDAIKLIILPFVTLEMLGETERVFNDIRALSSDITVLFTTGSKETTEIPEFLKSASAVDYIEKPFNDDALTSIVKKAVTGK